MQLEETTAESRGSFHMRRASPRFVIDLAMAGDTVICSFHLVVTFHASVHRNANQRAPERRGEHADLTMTRLAVNARDVRVTAV
jgi:hypothetical protein